MAWLALIGPPLIWIKAVWLSPMMRFRRLRLSGSLSLVAGALMFASIQLNEPYRPILFVGATLALIAMLTSMYWFSSSRR